MRILLSSVLFLQQITSMINKTTSVLLASALALVFAGCKGKKGQVNEDVPVPSFETANVAGMVQDTVTFTAADGLEVRGVRYQADSGAPVIVLCHQARFNNYEYAEIAPKLVAMGFTCLAIDQRSGDAMGTHTNATATNAKAKGLETGYQTSLPDIRAAVDYAAALTGNPVILWGSSYSATLVMQVAMESDKVRAAVGFSPILKFDSGDSAADIFAKYQGKPIFITSTEKEGAPIAKGLKHLGDDVLYQYYPETKGTHGSKALWSSDPASADYWAEVGAWLQKHK